MGALFHTIINFYCDFFGGLFFSLEFFESLAVKMDLQSGSAFVSVGKSGVFEGSRSIFMLVVWLGFPVPYRKCEFKLYTE